MGQVYCDLQNFYIWVSAGSAKPFKERLLPFPLLTISTAVGQSPKKFCLFLASNFCPTSAGALEGNGITIVERNFCCS